ncbi:MAG TPA: S26 family signal peptidase, partial [Chthoniobacteraceae bacterium]|nr:S26 family signal peptidase [Chthoniobacteraceae bacterium]
MFDFLLPKHVRQGRNLLKDAKKLLAYKRDLWSDATVRDYESRLHGLEEALQRRDAGAIEENANTLDRICTANLPPVQDAAMRENVEVFLVAIVIALGVRTYFLQPFTIPTGSMQPTLNGVLGARTDTPPPNPLVRIFEACWLGRSYVNVVAKNDCTVIGLREFKSLLPFIPRTPLLGESFGIFSRTEIVTATGGYVINEPRESLDRNFAIPVGTSFKTGEPIVRGYLETGDHVFVDKFSYHFRKPQRGEVFVFNTQHLPTADRRHYGSPEPNDPAEFDRPEAARMADQMRCKVDMNAPSQFY